MMSAPPPLNAAAAAPPSPPPSTEYVKVQDGVQGASVGGQLVTLVPTKVMVFIDGSWLYYSLFERGRRCPIRARFGAGWQENHYVDYGALPQTWEVTTPRGR